MKGTRYGSCPRIRGRLSICERAHVSLRESQNSTAASMPTSFWYPRSYLPHAEASPDPRPREKGKSSPVLSSHPMASLPLHSSPYSYPDVPSMISFSIGCPRRGVQSGPLDWPCVSRYSFLYHVGTGCLPFPWTQVDFKLGHRASGKPEARAGDSLVVSWYRASAALGWISRCSLLTRLIAPSWMLRSASLGSSIPPISYWNFAFRVRGHAPLSCQEEPGKPPARGRGVLLSSLEPTPAV